MKNTFEERAEEFYMDEFRRMFREDKEKKNSDAKSQKRLKKAVEEEFFSRTIMEEMGDNAEIQPLSVEPPDPDDEVIEDREEIPEDDKDAMDKADEVLEEIDLAELDNETRLELIRNIIDSAQNQSAEDDQMNFNDFMTGITDILAEFQYDEQPEEESEGEEMASEEEPIETPDEDEEDETASASEEEL